MASSKPAEKAFPVLSVKEVDREIRRYKRHRSRIRFLRALLLMVVIAVALGLYIASDYFMLVRVEGSSMRKTLENGDIVLCRKNAEFEKGDIIVFDKEDMIVIKRVIGTNGDRITVTDDGDVKVNGTVIDEPYVYNKALGSSDIRYPAVVKDGELFCLGDHRNTSIDSRSSNFGNVDAESVLGTVEAVLWPAYRIGICR